MKKILLIVLLLVGGLFFTKPDEEHFKSWYKSHLENQDESLVTSSMLQLQSNMTLNYEDNYLFATIEIGQGLKKTKYLGLFGTWIPIGGGSGS